MMGREGGREKMAAGMNMMQRTTDIMGGIRRSVLMNARRSSSTNAHSNTIMLVSATGAMMDLSLSRSSDRQWRAVRGATTITTTTARMDSSSGNNVNRPGGKRCVLSSLAMHERIHIQAQQHQRVAERRGVPTTTTAGRSLRQHHSHSHSDATSRNLGRAFSHGSISTPSSFQGSVDNDDDTGNSLAMRSKDDYEKMREEQTEHNIRSSIHYDGEQCPGCGITMQSKDPCLPGYYQIPKAIQEDLDANDDFIDDDDDDDDDKDALLMNSEDVIEDVDTTLEQSDESTSDPTVVCARCFSLVHYGKVKSDDAESLLPSFNLRNMVSGVLKSENVSRRLRTPLVIVVVADIIDFEGSISDDIIRVAQEHVSANHSSRQMVKRKHHSSTDEVKIILCVNKVDLLPSFVGEKRLREWINRRLVSLGLQKPDKICLVSAILGHGIQSLLNSLEDVCSVHSDVYMVGSQNAGKSSLINAMAMMTSGRCVRPSDTYCDKMSVWDSISLLIYLDSLSLSLSLSLPLPLLWKVYSDKKSSHMDVHCSLSIQEGGR